MFLLIQAYDVLDELHIRLHMVDDQAPDGAPMTVFKSTLVIHRPDWIRSERDLIALVGESVIDAAHSDNPLL